VTKGRLTKAYKKKKKKKIPGVEVVVGNVGHVVSVGGKGRDLINSSLYLETDDFGNFRSFLSSYHQMRHGLDL
jgi:hypothetical protein